MAAGRKRDDIVAVCGVCVPKAICRVVFVLIWPNSVNWGRNRRSGPKREALCTRTYSSTRYIHLTSPRAKLNPMEGVRRSGFQLCNNISEREWHR